MPPNAQALPRAPSPSKAIRVISPQKTALPAAVTAAILAFTSFTPALAAETPTENLDPDRGNVVSVETEELDTVVNDPELPSAPPKTGDKNPGATMGQRMKSMAETTNLSSESEAELEQVEKELDVKPAPAASASVGAVTPETRESAKADPSGTQTVGPAGSMSLMIQANTWRPAGIMGIDVSGWQPTVNWSAEYAMGARFAYVKATEGTGYKSPSFASQYSGSHNVGMIRGAYHFALPSVSSGAAQADYFVNNGGGWSADGKTLPGLLDVEYNPYSSLGNTCYNMSQPQMNSWIKSFSDRYSQRTGRLPAIYTTTDWWRTCTGNTAQFNTHPLHIASYNTTGAGAMPNGWSTYDIWQFSASGPFSGDSNQYRGSWAQLQSMASSRNYNPLGGRAPNTTNVSATYSVGGGIGAIYRATGGANTWGQPVMNEANAASGGRYQEFVRNGVKSTAYWHPRSGAHFVRNASSIGGKFIASGRERGYGFPIMEERTIAGGAYQVFRAPDGRQTKVLWSPSTGSRAVKEHTAIGRLWAQRGHERGLGYPTTDEYRAGNELRQQFSKGYLVRTDLATGRTWVARI